MPITSWSVQALRIGATILLCASPGLIEADEPLAPLAADDLPAPFFLHDPNGVPIAGVSISLVGRTGAVVTAADGSFRLAPEPTPPFQIVVIALDGALLGIIYIPALDNAADRRLVLAHGTIETVQVLSGVAPGSNAPPASGASMLSREELDRLKSVRLVDAMVEVPGASASGPGQTAVPSFRGMARGRTLVLLDGARVTTERRAGASATFLDPFSIGNLELVRGPASVAYGSDALGGVIHAHTPRPEPGVNFVGYEAAAGTGVGYGAFGGTVHFGLERGALLAQFHQRSFDDYRSPRGTVENSSARDSGGLLRGLIPAGGGWIDLGLQIDRARDVSRPTAESDPARTTYPLEDSDRVNFVYDLPGRGRFSAFELRAFLGRYRLITERMTDDVSTSTTRVSRSDVEANDASLRFIATRPGERGLLRAGIDVVSRFGLHADDRVEDHPSGGSTIVISDQETIADARRFDAGLFLEGERPFGSGPLSLAAGIRGDAVSTRNTGGVFGDRDTSHGALSGFAALTWRAGEGMETTLQASRGFRDPTLSDRYFQGTTGRGTITGNPDLDPETTRQFDLAFRVQRKRARLAVYGYLYRIHDLVERFEFAPDMFTFRNRGEEEILGLEIEWDLEIRPDLSARFTAGHSRGEIVDDGSYPDDIPGDSVSLSLLHRPGDRWWWQGRVRGVRGDDRPGPTEKETPGYAVLDASVGFDIADEIQIRLNLYNLTDKGYPSSSDARSPLAPGRSAALTLSGRF